MIHFSLIAAAVPIGSSVHELFMNSIRKVPCRPLDKGV